MIVCIVGLHILGVLCIFLLWLGRPGGDCPYYWHVIGGLLVALWIRRVCIILYVCSWLCILGFITCSFGGVAGIGRYCWVICWIYIIYGQVTVLPLIVNSDPRIPVGKFYPVQYFYIVPNTVGHQYQHCHFF